MRFCKGEDPFGRVSGVRAAVFQEWEPGHFADIEFRQLVVQLGALPDQWPWGFLGTRTDCLSNGCTCMKLCASFA